MVRKINSAGEQLIKNFEGCVLTAYPDPATGGKPWTIGYGHTGGDVTPGKTITAGEATVLLEADLDWAEAAVEQYVKVALTDNQFAALVSFTFNLGAGALQSSTLLKKLNAGNYAAVPAELAKWVNANGKKLDGLVRRRAAEAKLWNTPDASPSQPVAVDPAPGALAESAPAAGGLVAALVALLKSIFGRRA